MPTKQDLISALSETYKDMHQQRERDVEIQFMLDHYILFAASKGVLYDTLKGQSKPTGNDLCALLTLDRVNVEKCKESELLAFCFNARGSALMKRCVEIFTEKGSATIFFVAGKRRSIIVTNQHVLRPESSFIHWLPSAGALNDLYWADVNSIYGNLQLWV